MTDTSPHLVYPNSNKSVQEEPIMLSIQKILTYGVIILAVILVISGIVGIVNYIRKNAGHVTFGGAVKSFFKGIGWPFIWMIEFVGLAITFL